MSSMGESVKKSGEALVIGTAKGVESAGKIVGITGNIAVTGAETVKVTTNALKEGAQTAKEIAKAVGNKAGNITRVGLNSGKKTLEIASSTTGTVAALFSTIENKTRRYEASTKNKTIITQKALNLSQNSRAKLLANQQLRASSVQNKKSQTNMMRKIEIEKKEQKKVLVDSITVIKKLLNSTLLKLESLKEIVCLKKDIYFFSVPKCKYIIKHFDKKAYELNIDNYINSYKGYFDDLIVLLDTRLENYIYSNNINKSKKEYDEIKTKITNETYELSIFFEGIKQSIINIFSNIISNKRENLNSEEKLELKGIFNYMKEDINKRKGVKNFKKITTKPKINNSITNNKGQNKINNNIQEVTTQLQKNNEAQPKINNNIQEVTTQLQKNNPIQGAGKNNKKLKKNK